MELFESQKDILLSFDTDIDFENGDIMFVDGDEFIKRKVFKLLISEINDWVLDPQLGANPSVFIGEPNNRETAQQLKNFIESRIAPFIVPYVMDVRVIPLNKESVKCYIDISSFGNTAITIPFTLDFIHGITYTQFDNKVDKIYSTNTAKINAPADISQPNPIKNRISRQQ